MRATSRQAAGFTLIEVLAALLLLGLGVASVIGMIHYAGRLSTQSQVRATALATAEAGLYDPVPLGLHADLGDGDGDGWLLDGSLDAPASGGYRFTTEGWLNGYYLHREERSAAADVVDPSSRLATITVRVYAGVDDRYVTTLRRRLLRRTERP
jgi:prepilin-type N-terminal cleavage/methylation domain-containing protein